MSEKWTQKQLKAMYEKYIPPTDQVIVKDEETGEYEQISIRKLLRPDLHEFSE